MMGKGYFLKGLQQYYLYKISPRFIKQAYFIDCRQANIPLLLIFSFQFYKFKLLITLINSGLAVCEMNIFFLYDTDMENNDFNCF